METRVVNGDTYVGEYDGDNFNGKVSYANGGVFEGKLWSTYIQTGKGKIFQDKFIFEGTWQDGKGFGKITDTNGTDIDGTWISSYWGGKGKLVIESGAVFEGDFEEMGSGGGSGKVTFKTGEVYEGSWLSYLRPITGKGTFIFENGVKSEATWDSMDGTGKVFSDGNAIFEGTFIALGVPRTGKGEYSQNGIKLSGSWNEYIGTGIVETQGGKYEGTFISEVFNICSLLTGTGSYYSNGTLLTGTWKDGKGKGKAETETEWTKEEVFTKNNLDLYDFFNYNSFYHLSSSQGKLTTKNSTFEGQWGRNGIYSGKGKIFFDGNYYEGVWTTNENGETIGTGTITWSNDEKWEGTWTSTFSRKEGKGTIVNNGLKFTGEFKEDSSGKGIVTSEGDAKWEGEWKYNYDLINGSGSLQIVGLRLEGEWVDEKGTGTIKNLADDTRLENAEWKIMNGTELYQIKGNGVLYYKGNKYIGNWNIYDGIGAIIYPNGTNFIGKWDLFGDKNEDLSTLKKGN